MKKHEKLALLAYVAFLVLLLAIQIWLSRRIEARFQAELEDEVERFRATVYTPDAPPPPARSAPPIAPAAAQPVPEPQTFPVVEDIVPEPAAAPANGAAPAAEPALVAGRPVTEGQLEGPLV